MSKIEKMLQCNDCITTLNKICETLDYNDAEREVAAEVLLWLEMNKIKKEATTNKVNNFAWKDSGNFIDIRTLNC